MFFRLTLGHCVLVLLVFVALALVFQCLAKRLAGKNVSEMTCFCVEWDVKCYAVV